MMISTHITETGYSNVLHFDQLDCQGSVLRLLYSRELCTAWDFDVLHPTEAERCS